MPVATVLPKLDIYDALHLCLLDDEPSVWNLQVKSFQCCPLRNSFIEGYFQIDTRILRTSILHESYPDYFLNGKSDHGRKLSIWRLKPSDRKGHLTS
jgi:hypothetical protein